MKIAIVGGGITGLTAGYCLSEQGHQISIFEKQKKLGGLAAGFQEKKWSWSLENYFHHLFLSDHQAQNLIKKLGLEKKLFYQDAKTAIFQKGKTSQFDSALTVLRFPHLSLLKKMRAGLTTLILKSMNDWQSLEKITAAKWLKKYYGENVYQLLWQPLLAGKFHQFADQVSMAWFWARIKKRSKKLGYFQGGFQVLIDQLEKEIKKNSGQILVNQEIKSLNQLKSFDRILITTSLPQFLKMIKGLSLDYQEKLSSFQFTHALNLILVLKEKLLTDNTYWLNINQSDFPFIALVEHTNFINKKYYDNQHLVYLGGYYPDNHPFLKMKKEEVLKKFLPYLKKIKSDFNEKQIIKVYLKKSFFAQPVMKTNYSKNLLQIKTPLKNVFLANQSSIYPWDRGVNYAIELGKKAAEEI